MIRIVDYGLGNIQAFQNMYKRLNIEAPVARSADELQGATKLVLPGVGAFDHAISLLNRSGMRARLDTMVLEQRVPVLGVCVGMQIMAHSSDEGKARGLGWIDGRVRYLGALGLPDLMLPQMGWNDVNVVSDSRLFSQLESHARFYFLHSFYFECARQQDAIAVANYGIDFSCAVNSGNIFGVQFHPEKSHHYGTQLLKNFAEL